MTLTQPYLLVSIFPLGFLLMVGYVWRTTVAGDLSNRRPLRRQWVITLGLMALWSSTIMRAYSGQTFPWPVLFWWGVWGNYTLSLTCLSVLLSTQHYLAVEQRRRWLVTAVSLTFLVLSLGFDQAIWGEFIRPFALAGQTINQFTLWASVWVASCTLPLLAAWLLTRQSRTHLPISLYRNKIAYWSLTLVLFWGGCLIAAIHQPGQPLWQEIGVLLLLPAAAVGSLSLTRSQLPDLQLALRRLLRQLAGTLLVFGLTWLAFQGLVWLLNIVNDAPIQDLLLLLIAALFAILFTWTNRVINQLTKRLFLPSTTHQAAALTDYARLTTFLPDPKALGHSFLNLLQARLGVEDAWLWVAEDGPRGVLGLRPLASQDTPLPQAVHLPANSPLAVYLRQNPAPLVQYDLNILEEFAYLSPQERQMMDEWQRVVYIPLHLAGCLHGVLALGPKKHGDLYTQADFNQLHDWVAQFSPLLAQARHMVNLQQMNEYVLAQNQTLGQERQYLRSLITLYWAFISHISADLKRPFRDVQDQISRLQKQLPDAPAQTGLVGVQTGLNRAQDPLDRLVHTAVRLQNRANFQFTAVKLDQVARQVQRQLTPMAEARRVRIELDNSAILPTILGDEAQLSEAIHALLHNAIKFNKIGGTVTLTYGTAGSELYLRILDTGVGIPADRLPHIWAIFPNLNANGSLGNTRKTGIGLTLTHFIITAHGGRVEAESRYGTGSTFTLYLPLTLHT